MPSLAAVPLAAQNLVANLLTARALGAGDVDTRTALIASLFGASEAGLLYDPSDLSTMWQDAARTVPVTAKDQPVRVIDDVSGSGNHATAPSDAARPMLRESGGLWYLEPDGVDDYLAAPYVYSGSQDRTILMGYRGSGGGGVAVEGIFGQGNTAVLGKAWNIYDETTDLALRVGGNKLYPRTVDLLDHVFTNYWSTSLGSATSTTAVMRLDGSVLTPGTESAQTVNTDASNISLFSGSPISAFYNMRFYGGIFIRDLLTSDKINAAESWLATKSGVTL